MECGQGRKVDVSFFVEESEEADAEDAKQSEHARAQLQRQWKLLEEARAKLASEAKLTRWEALKEMKRETDEEAAAQLSARRGDGSQMSRAVEIAMGKHHHELHAEAVAHSHAAGDGPHEPSAVPGEPAGERVGLADACGVHEPYDHGDVNELPNRFKEDPQGKLVMDPTDAKRERYRWEDKALNQWFPPDFGTKNGWTARTRPPRAPQPPAPPSDHSHADPRAAGHYAAPVTYKSHYPAEPYPSYAAEPGAKPTGPADNGAPPGAWPPQPLPSLPTLPPIAGAPPPLPSALPSLGAWRAAPPIPSSMSHAGVVPMQLGPTAAAAPHSPSAVRVFGMKRQYDVKPI